MSTGIARFRASSATRRAARGCLESKKRRRQSLSSSSICWLERDRAREAIVS
jgi:hypothetical protein